ncbi:MAG: RES domain-containing protein [Spirochaetaceae bacterium]|jgi:hypothetical protein|nr:RES domain-containing protein [Spirochaetaceae bacterium]
MEDENLICGECIGEDYLKTYIKRNGEREICSYCGRMKKVLNLDDLLEVIRDGLEYIYDDPANGLAWEDGEYVEGTSPILDSDELLPDIFTEASDKVLENLNSYFNDKQWCKRDFYGLDEAEESFYTWERFKNIIKYKSRFFFTNKTYKSTDDFTKYKQPYKILERIYKTISSLKLYSNLTKGTLIYRARKGSHLSKEELSSPGPYNCKYSNRFSPAGISMFYASDNANTCLNELSLTNNCSIGTWEVQNDLEIYDFTHKFQFFNNRYSYNHFPSIFDETRRQYYHDYKFLLEILTDMSKKIIKNDEENIEYVPTQIVTEYLHIRNPKRYGLGYYSAINGQRNYCLFFDKKECLNEKHIKFIDSCYIK